MRATLAITLLLLSGCGYRNALGQRPLPGGLEAVFAPMLVNQTSEPGLEAVFTEALRRELQGAGVRADPAAPTSLEGAIVSVSGAANVLTDAQRLASYRLRATATLRLVRDGAVLRQAEVSAFEDYLDGVDVLETEANRQRALRRLAAELMRAGLERLSER